LDIVEESAPSETEEMSKAQPLEMKKWRYACRLFRISSKREQCGMSVIHPAYYSTATRDSFVGVKKTEV
jgi:hypothetical protein